MNRESTRLDYLSRIERVQGYIHDHLDDELDMDVLAEVACFSHYHWHRIYRGMTGETAAQTVRRLRLHRAAGELATSSSDIRGIARRAGYGSIEAFTRAFRAAFGEPPAAYRDRASSSPLDNTLKPEESGMYQTEIKTLEPVRLAATRHVGDYMKVDQAFQKVMMWDAKVGAVKGPPRVIGVYHDDPSAVDIDKLRSDAGIAVDPGLDVEAMAGGQDIKAVDLPGGRHAVVAFKGPYAELHKAYNWLFSSWLPDSGEEAAESPCYEEYLNDPRVTAPTELLTHICLKLKD